MKQKKQRQEVANESIAVAEGSAEFNLDKVPITIEGKEYFLSFKFGDLAEAEGYYRQQGHQARLLLNLPSNTMEGLRSAFPCLVRRHHPNLSWDDAQALVTLNSVYPIAVAVAQAFNYSEVKA